MSDYNTLHSLQVVFRTAIGADYVASLLASSTKTSHKPTFIFSRLAIISFKGGDFYDLVKALFSTNPLKSLE